MSDHKFRSVLFPCDFFKRRPFRRVRRMWRESAEYFLECVIIAREALNGGRVEAGGSPLLAEDLIDLWGEEPEQEAWFDDAVKHGLLLQDDDGCYVIPDWSTWYRDKDEVRADKQEQYGHSAPLVAFLRAWHLSGMADAPAKDLLPMAIDARLRAVDRDNVTTQIRSLTMLLSQISGREVDGYLVSQSRGRDRTFRYRIRLEKESNESGEDTFIPEEEVQVKRRRSAGVQVDCRWTAGGELEESTLILHPTSYRQQTTDYRLQPTDNRLQTTDYSQQTTDKKEDLDLSPAVVPVADPSPSDVATEEEQSQQRRLSVAMGYFSTLGPISDKMTREILSLCQMPCFEEEEDNLHAALKVAMQRLRQQGKDPTPSDLLRSAIHASRSLSKAKGGAK